MKKCIACTQLHHLECSKFQNIPPAGYADKCRYYDGPEDVFFNPCLKCERHFDDEIAEHCLRYDHPDYKLDFVKIKDGHDCPLGLL